ncbi:hypothetical protein JCM10212_000430 [Sporobolomyces blumeae]
MKSTTTLAISLGSIFGSILLVLSLAACRWTYRKHRKGRAVPVDPVYESKLAAEGGGEDGGARTTRGGKVKKWFGGRWGITPIAEPGTNGTKQYMSGWFALDAPTGAGWTSSEADRSFSATPDTGSQTSWRESHFSRASRASKRSSTTGSAKRKGPRPSRTTELGMLEKDDDEKTLVEKDVERERQQVGERDGSIVGATAMQTE